MVYLTYIDKDDGTFIFTVILTTESKVTATRISSVKVTVTATSRDTGIPKVILIVVVTVISTVI